MAYREDLRKKVIEYLSEGHSQRQAKETFHISLSTINKWSQQYQKTGDLKKKPLNRSYKKLNPEELRAYVAEHPDAYLKEIAEVFGCCASAVRKALARLGITRKKRRNGIGSKSRNR
jgi:transposase